MAGKFIELNEAAQMLGMTADELTELRSAGEIHGYRDGSSWKFKSEEVERVAGERGVDLGGGASEGSDDLGGAFDDDLGDMLGSDLDLDDDADGGMDSSVLISEEALGHSEESTSSTIIGKSNVDDLLATADSDLRLVPDEDDALSSKGTDSDVSLIPDATGSSGLDLDGDSSDVLGGDLKLASGSDTGNLEDAASAIGVGSGVGSSDLDLGSDLDLDDDDMVMGSGIGSDLTLGGGDSGINLGSPTDSGLSLEDDALDLGGSAISSLELPEDDEVIALDDELADPDQATQLKQDEEFLLSPYGDDAADDDDSDSGSQVIALEDSAAFDEEAPTMVQTADAGFEGAGLEAQLAPVAAAGAVAGAAAVAVGDADMAATPAAAPGQVPLAPSEMPEAPYSIWNVLGLMMILMFLMVTGVVMVDIVRNMWNWNGTYGTSTGLTDTIISMLGM